MTSAIEGHTVIFTADGEINAQQVRAFLEANGVPCIFRGESLRNVHGFTIDGLGKVDIFVPDDQVDRARALLAAAETGALRLADDTDVDR
jgi:hypothetical protein